ncbi:MAG: hypothetical protein ACMUIP_01480 [bacterium]
MDKYLQFYLLVALLFFRVPTLAEVGQVELPLSYWEQMKTEIESANKADTPLIPYCPIERSIEGEFHKGLFKGTLIARFEVLNESHYIQVPILPSDASLGKVMLNGKQTSLLHEGNMYILGVDKMGKYTVQVDFFLGREQERFARRIRFQLPEAGMSKITIRVPEENIEAKLTHGTPAIQRHPPRNILCYSLYNIVC